MSLRHRRAGLFATFVLALLAGGHAVVANQIRPLNLEQLTEHAARIFAGQCLEIRREVDPKLGFEIATASFHVDDAVKGASAGSTVTVRMLASDSSIPGAIPSFRVGDEVILFLYGESALGLSSPVGLGQGRFQVSLDKQGRRLARNDFGNANLLRGLSTGAALRLGPQADAKDLTAADLLHKVGALLSSGR